MQTSDPLASFEYAWNKARADKPDELPTLEVLAGNGAPLHHKGFAMLGRSASNSINKPQRYVLLEAGPDHALLGANQVGRSLDEFIHHAHLRRLVELYSELMETQRMHRWHCINMAANAAPMRYERVIAPIADDQGDTRCLAGVWVWDTNFKPMSFAEAARAQVSGETLQ